MLYAIFCYQPEGEVCAMSKADEEVMMAEIAAAKQRLGARSQFGPSARLMPTTAATTVRTGRGETLVMDGPFAETKEQLLGFYVVDCASLNDAIDVAHGLHEPRVKAGLTGALEIRPVHFFNDGK